MFLHSSFRVGKPAEHWTQARFMLSAGDRVVRGDIIPIPSDQEELHANQTLDVAASRVWGSQDSVELESAVPITLTLGSSGRRLPQSQSCLKTKTTEINRDRGTRTWLSEQSTCCASVGTRVQVPSIPLKSQAGVTAHLYPTGWRQRWHPGASWLARLGKSSSCRLTV